jgi:excinuclease ABC subunit A
MSDNLKWTPSREPRPTDVSTYKYILELEGCRGNNLKNVDVTIPLNRMVTVTGVSGSGKSSLISDTLYPALARELGLEFIPNLPFDSLRGVQNVKNVLFIDQSPIGTTARSNPVTYMKVYDAIRTVMASSNEARGMGYDPSTFSLNVDGGRCPVCKGLGVETIDMMFMDDIEVPCDECGGKRFRKEVLEITYRGKNIHEILNMTVAEAMDFFVNYPNIRRSLYVLREVGLDYITLGQSARTLSGGESQRLKVAREFATSTQDKTLYILDEPTTGLHFREIQLLIKVLNRLVDAGGSVLLIEHNLDIIRASDYIIDLGPDAGENGGTIVATGTPDDIKRNKKSLTGRYL